MRAANAAEHPPEPEKVLFDFGAGFEMAKHAAWGVKAEVVQAGGTNRLRVAVGHYEKWPGVTLKAGAAPWDLSPYEYVSVDVTNTGKNEVTVNCRIDNPGADGTKLCRTNSVTLAPGASGTIKVDLERAQPGPKEKLIGMRGFPGGGEGLYDPARTNQVIVFVAQPAEDHLIELGAIRAVGAYTSLKQVPQGDDFFPFIDTFGQYIHGDWPGKTHSAEELAARKESEAKELAARPGPATWDEYGGWKDGPALEATGAFRVAKHEGKWWLVDPAGKLFFSHGIDCVNASQATPLGERDRWWKDFPGTDEAFKEFFGSQGHVVHGYYKNKAPLKTFNFTGANLKRKYGPDWAGAFAETTHKRLRSWGMNTIANWSDEKIYLLRKTPYCVAVHFGRKPIQGSEGYWGQFPDPFDPDFKASLLKRMQQEKDKTASDKWCIGYFVDNEIAWGGESSLALAALKSPPEQAAKKAFLEILKAKYGEVAKLNAAWGTNWDSWEALAKDRKGPDEKKDGVRGELKAFYSKIAEAYFKNCRDAVKEVAPNRLYLGCRFAWVNNLAAAEAAKYCDVVSYNLYRTDISKFEFPGKADVPLIVGEFHFGALDRGMFHTGLVPVKNQAARAKAYAAYVTGALKHPQFVGTHWFQYMDESVTGRPLDEENYQIGFLDGVDTPYAETVEACRAVGYSMYETRAGK
ncbi:MAG: beta-galactosidase [Planctomycetota bacterium]|nr:beta-galactosidase [Planctomycetota bacterium]